ncbi:MAG TPA: IS701 family transposase [Azospirillaceae bacterium]|jgi:SRSO17 transposase|nr:IS701 family transposase [Azospirillaceae bacterium]
MDEKRLGQLQERLGTFLDEMTAGLGRQDRRRWAQTYVRGLLLDGDRKSAGAMAGRLAAVDRAERDYEQALQQFLGASPWDDRPVRDALARWAAGRADEGEEAGGIERFVVIDDTGFPKQGERSVAVARQYSGTLGKVGNCQVAVTLQFASQAGGSAAGEVVCLDAALYLPKGWAADAARCRAAGVPEGTAHRPKWELALEMLGRAKANGIGGLVLADADYGGNAAFRAGLEAQGWRYAVGIDSNTAVVGAGEDLGAVPPWPGVGPKPTRPQRVRDGTIRAVAAAGWASGHAPDFRAVTWRQGSRGRMRGRFAAWRVRPAPGLSARQTPGQACWLLAEWPEGEAAPTKLYFSNLPTSTPLKRLVAAAKGRWWVEQSYQQMKEELGLDHFEGRSWRGWHHHVTLVMLAYAFLASLRTPPPPAGKKGAAGITPPNAPTPNARPSRGSVV